MKTWGEVKQELEVQGVIDNMEIDYIAIYGGLGKIKVSLHDDNKTFTADQPERVVKAIEKGIEDGNEEDDDVFLVQYKEENKEYLKGESK